MCFFPQKESGAETASFYSALLRIQPKIVHCWRPMRRTFKAYDEGGTGLLSVADFRKVSSALGCLSCLNGEQWPNASGQTSKEDPSPPWGRPRCEWLSGTSFPWGPQVIPCPSPADPRFLEPWGGHDLSPLDTTAGATGPWSPGWAPRKAGPVFSLGAPGSASALQDPQSRS